MKKEELIRNLCVERKGTAHYQVMYSQIGYNRKKRTRELRFYRGTFSDSVLYDRWTMYGEGGHIVANSDTLKMSDLIRLRRIALKGGRCDR